MFSTIGGAVVYGLASYGLVKLLQQNATGAAGRSER